MMKEGIERKFQGDLYLMSLDENEVKGLWDDKASRLVTEI